MSASDHVSPQLFHGSRHYFSEGETITPSNEHLHGSRLNDPTPRVYLTSSLEEAKKYAGSRAAGAGKLFGPVYEVDAPDATPTLDDLKASHLAPYRDAYANTYTSTSNNLVPKKIVGWGINSYITEE